MVFDLTEHSVYLLIGAFFVWVVGDIINKLRKKTEGRLEAITVGYYFRFYGL